MEESQAHESCSSADAEDDQTPCQRAISAAVRFAVWVLGVGLFPLWLTAAHHWLQLGDPSVANDGPLSSASADQSLTFAEASWQVIQDIARQGLFAFAFYVVMVFTMGQILLLSTRRYAERLALGLGLLTSSVAALMVIANPQTSKPYMMASGLFAVVAIVWALLTDYLRKDTLNQARLDVLDAAGDIDDR